jgi:hypothetical protein
VNELEPLLGSEARLLGKGEPPLLHQHADVAELFHVVKARHASYHPLGTELLQGLEVKVPEALVPLACLVVLTSSKTVGLCYLHVEDVESISVSGYLGKKAMMTIETSTYPSPSHPVPRRQDSRMFFSDAWFIVAKSLLIIL